MDKLRCLSFTSVFTILICCHAGANVHATTATGDTALTYACENGHTDVADVLLQAGANLVRHDLKCFVTHDQSSVLPKSRKHQNRCVMKSEPFCANVPSV